MKQRRHRHKESYSILLISNTGQSSRHFHLSPLFFCLFPVLLLFICAAIAWLVYQAPSGSENDEILSSQLDSQSRMIQKLEDEKETLSNKNLALAAELNNLKQNIQTYTEGMTQTASSEPEPDPSIPARYPYSETGILDAAYSDGHPYLSINTQPGSSIIAAGNGTVVTLSSDDTYPVIIELDHGNGYQTRYMCLMEIDLQVEEGTQVQIGDVLAAIRTENTQMDYQVLLEGEPIDPLIVLEAKG